MGKGNIKMNIRHIFMTIAAVLLTSAALADSSSVTSKKYVDDFMAGYQNKIPGSGADKLMIYDDTDGIGAKQIVSSLGDDTSATNVPDVGAVKLGLDGKQDTINGTAGYVMTGTDNTGYVGERAIYGTSSQYNSALVTAETVNTAVTNAVNNSLIRVGEDGSPNPNGTLWEIVDDLTALNICSNYTTATGTVVQNGTPTPTNPIAPFFYQQGDMILRKVGDYADSYDASTNKITRRVGVKVLDGVTEGAKMVPAWNAAYKRGNFVIDGKLATDVSVKDAYCTHFNYNSEVNGSPTSAGFCTRDSGDLALFSFLGMNDINSSSDANAWLAAQYAAGTPVVVYYPLATPVTEDMPPRCQ